MPVLALTLALIWFLVLFVLRSILQWHRTGSTGVHLFSGPVVSTQWFAGMLAAAASLFGVAGPIAQLVGWIDPYLWLDHSTTHFAGIGLYTVGLLGAAAAQLRMGSSWRIGVDNSEQTDLVTGGLFAIVRNPIFSFVGFTAVGFFLLTPNTLSLIAVLCNLAFVQLQVRVIEEPYLLRTHPITYAAYAAQTGRFVPGIGRIPPSAFAKPQRSTSTPS